MKKILHFLYNHGKLDHAGAKAIMLSITENKYDALQVASFLTVFNMRPITVEELDGFRAGLMEKCLKMDFDEDCLDIVGTGGDGKNTFNISTLSAVVMAGAGVKVAKHGNNSVSSICGSSNVLKHLGYEFSNDKDLLAKQLEQNNLCFLHAPYFHPAMKSIVPIRGALGVKTFFNMLGPLVHPAQPKYNLFGVYNAPLSRLYQFILKKQKREFTVVYNLDGYDEISLTDQFIVRTTRDTKTLSPSDLGMNKYRPEALFGGDDISSNAKIFMNVLNDQSTAAQKDVIIANAGFGIKQYKNNISLMDALQYAKEAIESKEALNNFKKLLN